MKLTNITWEAGGSTDMAMLSNLPEDLQKLISSSDGSLVRPDIIVHRRKMVDLASNFLVIEIKKDDVSSDFEKLVEYTSSPSGRRSFQYQLGLSIELTTPPVFHWFENGQLMV